WGEMNGTPILSELYIRTGGSFPLGGKIMGELIGDGWSIGGGARALFFNAARDAAVTFDAGITTTTNQSDSDRQIPLSVLLPNAAGTVSRVNFGTGGVPGVTLRRFNQTT